MKTVKKFFRNPLSFLGCLLLVMFALTALAAPVLAPPRPGRDPFMIPRDGFRLAPEPPSDEHPFGTTEGQYDILYGMVWGTRTAFKIGMVVVGCAVLIGIIVGGVSGYFGGNADQVLMRITDVFLSFPFLVAAMVITVVLGKGLTNMMIALILFGWMEHARLVRVEVLRTKASEFIMAARVVGSSNLRILLRHVMPNSIYPVFVSASMATGSMVVTAAALSFLGVGTEVGYADWGQMISFSRAWIIGQTDDPFKYWYTVVIPGSAIFLFMLAWTFIGDGLRDILDPRLKGVD
ncbi:MAG: ABC transporter permease [Anaerolineales bacterium]|nr:ABC transporter permease [Anaerolineales bacterium]